MGRGEGGILNAASPEAALRPLGLYVHLPFCSSRCAYCDFHSHVCDAALMAPLNQAILFQLAKLASLYDLSGRTIDSIFLGGGTPSIWPTDWLADLLSAAARHLPLAALPEITIEANPDSLSLDKLTCLRRAGYNRLSLGVQSFDAACLQRLGRAHKPGQALRAREWALKAGFTNFSLDIIYGLPWQTLNQAGQDVSQALALNPQHLSVYQLTLNPRTVLGKEYSHGQAPMPNEYAIAAMEEQTLALCQQAGFNQYEVSNYAAPGFQCRHNAATWQGGDYLALGPGGHGHWGQQRWANLYDLPAYIAAWQTGGNMGYEFVETLERSQQAAEIFMLGLRTRQGVNLKQLDNIIGKKSNIHYAQAIQFLTQNGWARVQNYYLLPTPLGLKMADRAALEFI